MGKVELQKSSWWTARLNDFEYICYYMDKVELPSSWISMHYNRQECSMGSIIEMFLNFAISSLHTFSGLGIVKIGQLRGELFLWFPAADFPASCCLNNVLPASRLSSLLVHKQHAACQLLVQPAACPASWCLNNVLPASWLSAKHLPISQRCLIYCLLTHLPAGKYLF